MASVDWFQLGVMAFGSGWGRWLHSVLDVTVLITLKWFNGYMFYHSKKKKSPGKQR